MIVHQDDFYKHDELIPIDPVCHEQDWDCLEAFDMDTFNQYIIDIKKNNKLNSNVIVEHHDNVDDFNVDSEFMMNLKDKYDSLIKKKYPNRLFVIVEGIMLFHNQQNPLLELFDLKLLIRSPYDILKKRRESRKGYQTLDSFWVDPPNYFDNIVYKNYEKEHYYLFIDNNVENNINNENNPFNIKDFDNSNVKESLLWIFDQIKDEIN